MYTNAVPPARGYTRAEWLRREVERLMAVAAESERAGDRYRAEMALRCAIAAETEARTLQSTPAR